MIGWSCNMRKLCIHTYFFPLSECAHQPRKIQFDTRDMQLNRDFFFQFHEVSETMPVREKARNVDTCGRWYIELINCNANRCVTPTVHTIGMLSSHEIATIFLIASYTMIDSLWRWNWKKTFSCDCFGVEETVKSTHFYCSIMPPMFYCFAFFVCHWSGFFYAIIGFDHSIFSGN